MKEDYKDRGFTMLEMAVTLVLFTLLLGTLWQFFNSTFTTYKQFDNRSNLNDQSRLVSSFIREEIRSSDEVTIVVTTGSAMPPLEVKIEPMEVTSADLKIGYLKRIELFSPVIGATRKGDRIIELQPIGSPTAGQGKYQLVYKSGAIPSVTSVISDKIENIKVTRLENSPIAEFECILKLAGTGDENERQKVINVFSESLEYKVKYTP